MDIAQAKEQIRKACIAYLSKDEHGCYVVPFEAQRPVFLMGAPGIGKTAVVAQVAREMELALVDYSMTHHTRQSVMGLPVVSHRSFGGEDASITEYTMSEIVASIYDAIESTGVSEGILFLDEINCVSETLMPLMLRFLQSKCFGSHRIPEGWVIVSAGNPPEYNRNARLFDVVTLDRVKLVEIDPDFGAWRNWASGAGVHPAVIAFLDLRPDCFYSMQTEGRERRFVTARAWSDLSTMMRLYEANGFDVDDLLIEQYIHIPAVAKDFAVYCDMFASLHREYEIEAIINGVADVALRDKASSAGLDERMVLCGLLVDALAAAAADVNFEKDVLLELHRHLSEALSADDPALCLARSLREIEGDCQAGSPHPFDLVSRRVRASVCDALQSSLSHATLDREDPAKHAADDFNRKLSNHRANAEALSSSIDSALGFLEDAFGRGNELTICLGDMTRNVALSRFIAENGSDAYFALNDTLRLEMRASSLVERLAAFA